MKTRTLDELRKCGPCYDPVRWVPENWEGTAVDFLNIEECPAKDRIWMVTRRGLYYTDRQLRLFACDCAERALSRIKNPDPRSLRVVVVARRYAEGNAAKGELDAARYAARGVADDAAYSAAGFAVYSAAGSAAGSAEREWQIDRLKEYAEEGE